MRWKILSIVYALASIGAFACDCCKPEGLMVFKRDKPSATPIKDESWRRWSFDTTVEYRNWKRVNPSRALEINDRPHGHIHDVTDEFFVTGRVGFEITHDFSIGLSQGYRHLRQQNVEDPEFLGQHEYADGATDLDFDFKYRFMHQREHGFPVDLTLFGNLKPPTGQTNERSGVSGELIDAENQPGTGSWDGGLGISATKQWGDWHAFGAVGGVIKGEGTQHFKAGDIIRVAMGASRKLPWEPAGWKLYGSFGGQFVNEFKGKENGEVDRNHGGQTIYADPGFVARPIDRLSLSINAPVPVYQELNGAHQKQDYSLVFNVGVRF